VADAQTVSASLIASFDGAFVGNAPYRYWVPDRLLPAGVCEAIVALPVDAPEIGDTLGKRETHNSTRRFFAVDARAKHPVCEALAGALQSEPVVAQLERLCDVDLRDSNLRIEYCLDTDGFWLEPHTDIGVKKFTMLIYLADDPGSQGWDADVNDPRGDHQLLFTAPYKRNSGFIFVPGPDTWHGFHKRPIHACAAR